MTLILLYALGFVLTMIFYKPEEKGELAWGVVVFWPITLLVILFKRKLLDKWFERK